MDKALAKISSYVLGINVDLDNTVYNSCTAITGKLLDLKKLSSKEIREGRSRKIPVTMFRSGLLMTPLETINWANRLNKLTCTRLKSVLLRVAHKEVYYKEKLHRYGLTADPFCARCSEIENFTHKFFECEHSIRIWREVFRLTKLQVSQHELIEKALGASSETNVENLTIHGEVLNRILSMRNDATYVINPKTLVTAAIVYLRKRETRIERREFLNEILIQ